MEIQPVVGFAFQILMGVSLAACAGFRTFLPLLVIGVAGRLGVVPLADRFEWLGSWPALLVLGTAVIVEALADKVPFVDHLLDLVATVARPVAGALAVASPLTTLDPVLALVVGVVIGSTVAGGVHLAKAQTRLVSTASTGGIANPLLSLAEDGVALAGSLAAVFFPLLGFLMLATLLLLLFRFARRRRRGDAGALVSPPAH